MEIKFLKTRSFGDGIGLCEVGQVRNLPKDQAEQFVSQGLAERVTAAKEKQPAKLATQHIEIEGAK